MSETFNFYRNYIFNQIILSIVTFWPLVIIAVATWQLFFSSDPLSWRVIVFVFITSIMTVFFIVLRKHFKESYGPELTYYEITVSGDGLICKNKLNSLSVDIKNIKNIKIGRNVFFIYFDDHKINIPFYSNAQIRPFLDSIKQLRPDLDVSYYSPFTFIKP